MIKENNMDEVFNYSFRDGENVTLENIASIFMEKVNELQIPVICEMDQIKTGGLFNSSVENCLNTYHPEHKTDYYHYCIMVSRQGLMAFVKLYVFGNSKQDAKFIRGQELKQNADLFSLIGRGINAIGKNKNSYQQEANYYTAVRNLIEEIFE